jgi:hypothetical protein
MKNQTLLDELGRKPRKERVRAILQNSDYILGEEFLSFLQGLLEFAKTTSDDPGYFERIYVGENTEFLNLMKTEMEEQAELVKDVWNSIQDFKNQQRAQVLIKTSDAQIFNTAAGKSIEEVLPCGKCDELIKSHGLCNGCLSGRFPDKVSERLQNNDEFTQQHLVSNKEIISNQQLKH